MTTTSLKGTTVTLEEKLASEGVFKESDAEDNGIIGDAYTEDPKISSENNLKTYNTGILPLQYN